MPQADFQNNRDWLAERFEENRGHLRAVAYRMLGTLSEVDDAIQEAWLRLSQSDSASIENLEGWLTTVVARVCLDILRSRASRREDALDPQVVEPVTNRAGSADPEQEALLADSIGIALLVVLNRLNPAERLAFVLHDMFAMPFEEIATIVGRSPDAARQLASRARRRVQGAGNISRSDINQQRSVVDAFVAALRAGDFQGIVAVLDPDVVVRIDETAAHPGPAREVHGAENWAKGAVAFSQAAAAMQPAILDGRIGLVLAPNGKLFRALRFGINEGKIAQVEIIGDAVKLRDMQIAVLDDMGNVRSD